MDGFVTSINGDTLKIVIDEPMDLYKVNRLADGKKLSVSLKINDNRLISVEQRKKIYALLNDLSCYTGELVEIWKDYFKNEVECLFGLKSFSLADCSKTAANYMILAILNFMFENDIPFKTEIWDSLPSEFPKQMLCLKNKRCVLCGKKADIAHFNAVGMGRNRQKISHVGMYIMTLCREHHTEQHKIGIKNFCMKYHIKPIKVDKEIAKQLNLGVIKHD